MRSFELIRHKLQAALHWSFLKYSLTLIRRDRLNQAAEIIKPTCDGIYWEKHVFSMTRSEQFLKNSKATRDANFG
jgi:hypothetical protein